MLYDKTYPQKLAWQWHRHRLWDGLAASVSCPGLGPCPPASLWRIRSAPQGNQGAWGWAVSGGIGHTLQAKEMAEWHGAGPVLAGGAMPQEKATPNGVHAPRSTASGGVRTAVSSTALLNILMQPEVTDWLLTKLGWLWGLGPRHNSAHLLSSRNSSQVLPRMP